MSDYKNANWINASGQLGGHPTHLRRNESLTKAMQKEHPYALIVNLVYQEVDSNGLPCDEDELTRIDEAEEAIADRFSSSCDALFALIVTGNGTRDLFLYLSKPLAETALEKHLTACKLNVNYDFSLHHAPDWRPYYDLLGY